MNKSFLNFHDKIVTTDLLLENPALTQQLRQLTEQFFLLAKASSSPSLADSAESDHEDAPSSPESPAQLVTTTRPYKDIGLGYVQFIDPEPQSLTPPTDPSSPHSDMAMLGALFDMPSKPAFPTPLITRLPTPPSLQILDGAVSSQYRAPYTFSIEETSFSRRLHRASLERGYHMLSHSNSTTDASQKIFQLSFIYHTRESLMSGLHATLMRDTHAPLEAFDTPFIHLGGAGTHFGKRKFHNSFVIKSGPMLQRPRLQSFQTGFDAGIELDFDTNSPEYQGEWFDALDVEGFLEYMGFAVEKGAVFAEAKAPADGPLIAFIRQNGGSAPAPKALEWNDRRISQGSINLFPELGLGSDLNERVAASNDDITAWIMGTGGNRTPELASRFEVNFPSAWDPVDAVASTRVVENGGEGKVNDVTIDVGTLVESEFSCSSVRVY
jgi:hypothetical protein